MCQGVTIIHKLKLTNEPQALKELYTPFNQRIANKSALTKIYLKHKPKTKTLKNSFIHKITEIYNTLEDEILTYNICQFKKNIKHQIYSKYTENKIPNLNTSGTSASDSE